MSAQAKHISASQGISEDKQLRPPTADGESCLELRPDSLYEFHKIQGQVIKRADDRRVSVDADDRRVSVGVDRIPHDPGPSDQTS